MTFPETFISRAEVKGMSHIRFSLEIIDPASFFSNVTFLGFYVAFHKCL